MLRIGREPHRVTSETDKDGVDQKRLADAGSNSKKETQLYNN